MPRLKRAHYKALSLFLSAFLITSPVLAEASEIDAELVDEAARGNAAAQFELGLYYGQKDQSHFDPAKFVYWCEMAAKSGVNAASRRLAESYQKGLVTSHNHEMAALWYRHGAEQGDVISMLRLATIYLDGTGVSPNRYEAARWLQEAANLGDRSAAFRLGLLYEHGVDGSSDMDAAARWYGQAAYMGDLAATVAYERIVGAKPGIGGSLPEMTAATVYEIQQRLDRLGFSPGIVDGAVGPRTQEAVRAYQRASGLKVDGVPGPGLLERLRRTDEEIRQIQRAAGLPVDGKPSLALLNYLRSQSEMGD